VEFGEPEAVVLGKMLPKAEVTGSFIPVQRVSDLENTQQESVAFGEVAEQ